MDRIFLLVLNMSLTGAFVIAAICLARLPLKSAPKIISYCLWAIAGFRLAVPFSIESVFSLIPFRAQVIPPDIAIQQVPRIDSGMMVIDDFVSGFIPAPSLEASANPLQILTAIGAWVWVAGVAAMLIYGVVSFVTIKRGIRDAAHVEANIFEAGNIETPFVLGFIKPVICLPSGLSEKERSYIVLHEKTHIKRRDHLVKLAAYFILSLHWFNPLAWVAFMLVNVDMEMSCDECVLKEIGSETKKDYSRLLLSMATQRRVIGGSPLAFGEGVVKGRLINILNFKKASRTVIIAAVGLLVIMGIGFSLDRVSGAGEEVSPGIAVTAESSLPGALTEALTAADNDLRDDSTNVLIAGIMFRWYDVLSGREMTVDDVLFLAQKGYDLKFEDFSGFEGISGMGMDDKADRYFTVFDVQGGHRLIIRRVSDEIKNVSFTCLRQLNAHGGVSIDIRRGGLERYLICLTNPELFDEDV
jgi:beta-lactamase regulating signal transducer with metallopeptidase domain